MTGQDLSLFLIQETFPEDRLLIPHHDCKGLRGAAFAQAEAVDSLLISGIAAQMKAADPLDRDDPSVENGSARSCNGIPAPEGVSIIIIISISSTSIFSTSISSSSISSTSSTIF